MSFFLGGQPLKWLERRMSYLSTSPRLVGGRLILDFLNTADWSRDGGVVDDKLDGPADLATWLDAVGLPRRDLSELGAGLAELRGFRSEMRGIFLAALGMGDVSHDALATLNRAASRGSDALVEAAGDHATVFARTSGLARILAISAAAVLGDPRESCRVKLCPGGNCGWLFLDETKNGRRRWCTMETCGNRAKASRHYKSTKTRAS